MFKENETSNPDNMKKNEPMKVKSAKIITEMIEGRMYYEIEWITMDGEEKTGYSSFKREYVEEWLRDNFLIEDENEMVTKSSWKEFKDSKLLWWVNTMLHVFGWSIVYVIDADTDEIEDVYPARVKYRGFSEKSNTEGYKGLSKYMVENAKELLEEAEK